MCVAYMKNVRFIHHFVFILVSNGYSIHHDSIHFISVTTGGKSTTFKGLKMIMRDKRLKGLENEIKRINKNYKKLIDDVSRMNL